MLFPFKEFGFESFELIDKFVFLSFNGFHFFDHVIALIFFFDDELLKKEDFVGMLFLVICLFVDMFLK